MHTPHITVLRNIVSEIGLDADLFEEALSNPELDAEVSTDVQTASEYGITGVPAMLFMGKYILSGAQPYDELVKIVEQIKERDNIT